MGGFAHKVIKSSANICFVQTKDKNGEDTYYFIKLEPAKENKFIKDMKGTDLVDFTSYGELLASGFGHYPSDAVKFRLKAQYDYDAPI